MCGQEYSSEFGVGQSPAQGSCSGDCHSLAVSLVTNKFTKDFLWSKCSAMCLDKYSFSLFRYSTGFLNLRLKIDGTGYYSYYTKKRLNAI